MWLRRRGVHLARRAARGGVIEDQRLELRAGYKEDGVSLNQWMWITATVAQKIGRSKRRRDFFKRAAGNASCEDLRPCKCFGRPARAWRRNSLPSSRHAETLVGARVMARARRLSKRQPELEQLFMPPDISVRQTPLEAVWRYPAHSRLRLPAKPERLPAAARIRLVRCAAAAALRRLALDPTPHRERVG
jgi:hypothetical protein